MYRIVLTLGVVSLVACAAEPSIDEPGDPTVSEDVAYSFAFSPMGFARVAVDPNGTPSLVTKFNSSAGGTGVVTVAGTLGNYSVTFNGLGAPVFGPAGDGGNVQITAEGTTNVRCRAISWGGAPNVTVSLQCNTHLGGLAGTPFAVGFYRRTTPAPTGFPTGTAYAWVTTAGTAPASWNYNSSGVLNTVVPTPPGKYRVNISNASTVNASMMVTPYGGALAGNVCSIFGFGLGFVDIECRDRTGVLVDSAFNFSFSTTGPAPSQQGGHTRFDGVAELPAFTSALGKIMGCSPAAVSAGRVASLAGVRVFGDIGPWDATPFVRASFVNSVGPAGYCKVESLTDAGAAPMSVGTTTVRCYTALGAIVAIPRFTFTHETSDAAGPC